MLRPARGATPGRRRRRVEPPPGLAALDDARRTPPLRPASPSASASGDAAPAPARRRPGGLPHPAGGAHQRRPARRRQRRGRASAYGPSALELTVSNPTRAGARVPRRSGSRHRRHARAGGAARRHARGGSARTASSASAPACRTRATAHEPAPVRVLLVDDDDLMRAGLKAVLSTDDAIEVVGEAGDGRARSRKRACARPGRRAHGRAHARPRRDRRDARGPRRLTRGQGRDPDDVRAGRLHLRRAERRRLRLPAQAHEARGADRRDPHDRRRRLAALAVGHPTVIERMARQPAADPGRRSASTS